MTEEDKEGLIDLITWYRDEYHKNDFGHTEMIEQVKEATNDKELDMIERIADGWLDMRDY